MVPQGGRDRQRPGRPLSAFRPGVYRVPVESRTIIRKIEADGWVLVRVTGSHHHVRHVARPGTTTVAHPVKNVPKGNVHTMERQSGVKLGG